MAQTSLGNLGNRLLRRVDIIEQSVNQLAIEVALTIEDGLTLNTPVDTSQAISNWQVELGSPPEDWIEAYARGKFGSTEATSRAVARRIARNVLSHREPGQPIYISNLLPYIGFLNDGSSKQAPAGFVQAEVMKGRKVAQRGLRLK